MVNRLNKWTIFTHHQDGLKLNVNFLTQRPAELGGSHLILTLGQGAVDVIDHNGEGTSEAILDKVITWAASYFIDYTAYVEGEGVTEIVFEIEEIEDGSTTSTN